MDILFILVEPAVPENIGSAARAMKTMGFRQLRLVHPVDPLSDPARWLAHGATDILENAEIFSSLKNALHDIDLIIGTLAKPLSVRNESHPVFSLPQIIKAKGDTLKKTQPSTLAFIMERLMLLKEGDLHLLHSVCNKFKKTKK